MKKAIGVQERRMALGKKGIAQAVRLFLKISARGTNGVVDWDVYNKLKAQLPFIDPHAPDEPEEEEDNATADK